MHRFLWKVICEEYAVRIGIIGMVAVHPNGRPALPIEITFCDQPPRMQQEDQFSVTMVWKIDAELAELLLTQNPPCGTSAKLAFKFFPAILVAEPKAGHGRV